MRILRLLAYSRADTHPISVSYLDTKAKTDFWNNDNDFTINKLNILNTIFLPLHGINNRAIWLDSSNNYLYFITNGNMYYLTPEIRISQIETDNWNNYDGSNAKIYWSVYDVDTFASVYQYPYILFKNRKWTRNYSATREAYGIWEDLTIIDETYNLDLIANALHRGLILRNCYFNVNTFRISGSMPYIHLENCVIKAKQIIIRDTYKIRIKDTSIEISDTTGLTVITSTTDETINDAFGTEFIVKKLDTIYGYIQLFAEDFVQIYNTVIKFNAQLHNVSGNNFVKPLITIDTQNIQLIGVDVSYTVTNDFSITHDYPQTLPPFMFYGNKIKAIIKNSKFDIKYDGTATIAQASKYYPTIYQFSNDYSKGYQFYDRLYRTVFFFYDFPKFVQFKNNIFKLDKYAILIDTLADYYNLYAMKDNTTDITLADGVTTSSEAYLATLDKFITSQAIIVKNNTIELNNLPDELISDKTIDLTAWTNSTIPIFEEYVATTSNFLGLVSIIPPSLLVYRDPTLQHHLNVFLRASYFYRNIVSPMPKYTFLNNSSFIYPNATFKQINGNDFTDNSHYNSGASRISDYFVKALRLPFIYKTIPHAIGWGWDYSDGNTAKLKYDENLEDIW